MNVNTPVSRSLPQGLSRFVSQASGALGALALVLVAPSCSTSSSGEFDGDLFVEACSLGCTNGVGGSQVFCSIVNTFRNQEISVLFSEPIDLSTVTSTTFRVTNTANGTSPVGEFFLDPNDARRLIFRPALSFDENGIPSFSFEANSDYAITVPGESQGDDPPFIRSITGRPNQSRLACTITTSDDLLDPVPGPPTVEIFMDRVLAVDDAGNPTELDLVTTQVGTQRVFDGFGTDGLENNLANGDVELTQVFRESQIWFRFRDIMNPSTLANPSTGLSQNVTVFTDEDGLLISTADQTPVPGLFAVTVDSERLETLLSFTPSLPFPSAGDAPLRIVVRASDSIEDLVQNSLEASGGGGTHTAIPETLEFDPIMISQDFNDPNDQDDDESAGVWGNGRVVEGFGGGSGRLGELRIQSGQTVTLNTDSQDFPLPAQGSTTVRNLIGNAFDDDGDPNTPDVFPTTITVDDGVFEFTSLIIENGATLRLEGSNPARILVRGPVTVVSGGLIDLSGTAGAAHDSTELAPEFTGSMIPESPAAGSGQGGYGGDRWNAVQAFIDLAPPTSDAQANPNFVSLGGRSGEGVGGAANQGRGRGGAANPLFPARYPQDTQIPGTNTALQVMVVTEGIPLEVGNQVCIASRVAGSGSGGAYALNGGPGVSLSPNLDGMSTTTQEFADWPAGERNNPSDTLGGQASELGLAAPNVGNAGYTVRTLDWFVNSGTTYPGFLRGGSGGGGSGTHYYYSLTLRTFGTSDCNLDTEDVSVIDWHDHSGARGGGGGGALQLASGGRLLIEGQIDASGGEGGSPLMPANPFGNYGRFAMPAGGGSGGALLLQGFEVELAPFNNRLLVDGGAGGAGVWSQSTGGDGSPGLVRIEEAVDTTTHADYAPHIDPVDGMDPLSLSWLSVEPEGFTDVVAQRPDSISASVSCWIRPEGAFFQLNFDEASGPGPEEQGWNIDVLWDPTGNDEVAVPFLGTSTVPGFPNGFAAVHGNILGNELQGMGSPASPVVIRFQGARAASDLTDPCNVELFGAGSPIVSGSLTPWVDSPALLNDFAITPNMFRFVIIFDGTIDSANGDTPGNVLSSVSGLTNLRVNASPL